jgi:hypothetical protein
MSFGPGGYGNNPPPVPLGAQPKLPAGVIILTTNEDTGPDATGSYVLGRNIVYQFATGDVATAFFAYGNLTAQAVADAGATLFDLLATIYGTSSP